MNIYDLVKQLLTDYPELRSNDKRLIWAVWYKQGIVTESTISRDKFYHEAEYPESITRARRKVQELNPHLQADLKVKEQREEKQADKGTFIFREEVSVPFETKVELHNKYKQMLISKGLIKKT